MTDAERTKILLWLSTAEYATHHLHAKKGRVDGTGQWLLHRESFQKWETSSASTILWLHGIRKIFSAPASKLERGLNDWSIF